MGEFTTIKETPLSLVSVKEKLAQLKKLSYRGKRTEEYLSTLPLNKNALELAQKIGELGIQKLKDKHIIRIVDMGISDIDSLKIVLSGDLSLKEEEIQKLFSVLEQTKK